MFKKSFLQKKLCLLFIVFTASIMLTSCSGGLPNGRYEPVDERMRTSWMQAIIIDGNNFTTVMPLTGHGITMKYEYKNGTLSFPAGGGTAVGVACEYKDGSLWYAGVEFKKTN